ncbi:MAG: hypothetical protein AB7I37_17735 [Pirellulales bacterium]
MKTYKTVNGTSYDARTPEEVIRVLESARLNRTRLHISLGETDNERGKLGQDWLEEFETHGYVGRSMGPVKVPILLSNSRSIGGGAILDHCVVRIRASAGGRVLWQHPQYHFGVLEIRHKAEPVELPDGRVLTVDVLQDGAIHASFETVEKARRWANKLGVTAPIAA